MVKKKTKRVERIILEPQDNNDPYKEFAPRMYFPYESNHQCFVAIECPTHKKAKDLIKQLLKDQKDLVKAKAKIKEYKIKENQIKDAIREHLDAPVFQPDYNSPG